MTKSREYRDKAAEWLRVKLNDAAGGTWCKPGDGVLVEFIDLLVLAAVEEMKEAQKP